MKPKLILLSGGSRGLGAHLATHLLQAGHAVATFARKPTPLMQELAAAHPGRFEFLASDAGDLKTLGGYINRMADQFGGIHGLVNNAAIGQDHLLVHTAPDIIHSIIATNIEAPILLTRLVLKHMLLQDGGGRIVNISSICGLRGYTGLTAYSASKGAMDAFTRSLAHEVSARGILVNAIAPGFFESEMSSVLAPEQLATIRRRTPTQRMTTDHNLVPLLDMLLFGDTNMTGQTIVADGGTSS
jgi:3-oxoacyl-[acyl-carrier protein] reductase